MSRPFSALALTLLAFAEVCEAQVVPLFDVRDVVDDCNLEWGRSFDAAYPITKSVLAHWYVSNGMQATDADNTARDAGYQIIGGLISAASDDLDGDWCRATEYLAISVDAGEYSREFEQLWNSGGIWENAGVIIQPSQGQTPLQSGANPYHILVVDADDDMGNISLNEFLIRRRSGPSDNIDFYSWGNLASTEQICEIFAHELFLDWSSPAGEDGDYDAVKDWLVQNLPRHEPRELNTDGGLRSLLGLSGFDRTDYAVALDTVNEINRRLIECSLALTQVQRANIIKFFDFRSRLLDCQSLESCENIGESERNILYTNERYLLLALSAGHEYLLRILDNSLDILSEREASIIEGLRNEDRALTQSESSGMQLFGLHWGMGIENALNYLISQGWRCNNFEDFQERGYPGRPYWTCSHSEEGGELEINEEYFVFSCDIFGGCEYSVQEVAQAVVDAGVINELQGFSGMSNFIGDSGWMADTFGYCGRGPAGDMLCVTRYRGSADVRFLGPKIFLIRDAFGQGGMSFQ